MSRSGSITLDGSMAEKGCQWVIKIEGIQRSKGEVRAKQEATPSEEAEPHSERSVFSLWCPRHQLPRRHRGMYTCTSFMFGPLTVTLKCSQPGWGWPQRYLSINSRDSTALRPDRHMCVHTHTQPPLLNTPHLSQNHLPLPACIIVNCAHALWSLWGNGMCSLHLCFLTHQAQNWPIAGF